MQRLTGEVARDLFRYVRRVEVRAHVLDASSASAVELWQQLKSARIARLNPRLEVTLAQSHRPTQPTAEVLFVDGGSLVLVTEGKDVRELRHEILTQALSIEAAYENEGKTLDES